MTAVEDTSSARLQATPEGLKQFRALSYGISAHWGLYALVGKGEWAMHQQRIPTPEYEKLVAQFNPTRFNAQEWVDLFADAGAEAFKITTKHHDGFCLYDSALTDYTVMRTPFRRDIIRELADACHWRGIRLYFYYSLLDWHHPAYRDDWPAYVRYYQGQVRELCTNYGEIGGITFDGYWPRFDYTPETEYFRAGGGWHLAETYDLIHQLQPNALVVNNHHVLPLKGEDYQIWELDMPGENTVGFNTTDIGTLPRATWFNLNTGWSYISGEQNVKPAERIIRYLTDSANKQAFCWLNIDPLPDGSILAQEANELRQVGAWLRSGGREKIQRA
jgi:alpha-L-fucosidase